MGALEIFDGFIEAAGSLSELAGAKVAASGEIAVTEALGKFTENDVARGIFRIEKSDAFIASESFDVALLLLVELSGSAELLDGFSAAVLLLKKQSELHQAIGRLRKGAKKAGEDGGGFGSVTGIDEAVELSSVELSGEGGLVEASVDIGESQYGFLVGRDFFEDRLVFGGGLAEFIFLESASRTIEMLVCVRSHGSLRASGDQGGLGKTDR